MKLIKLYRDADPAPSNNGGAPAANSTTNTAGGQNTTTTTPTVPASPYMAGVDQVFSSVFEGGGKPFVLEEILHIKSSGVAGKPHTNTWSGGSSVVINADRLILNTKADHLFLCGQAGVTITSPKSVHIDSDDDVYIFSQTGEIYLGLPNRGESLKPKPAFNPTAPPRPKWQATPDGEFEPVVLGTKLANLLDDMLTLIRDLIVRGVQGDSRLSPENMTNVEFLIKRIPEILSTVAFVDGYSHEQPDNKPPSLTAVADYFKLSSTTGTVDKAAFEKEMLAVGYNENELKAFANVSGSTYYTPATATDTKTNNTDGAVGEKKTT